jgi:hypothetical protein
VSFESGPQDPTPTNDSTPTFQFSASDPLAGLECSVDGEAPAACSSPFTTAVLGDGPHRLAVRAIDALQNAGEWANRDFTVDTSVPEVSFTEGPDGPTRARRPAFAFASAPGSSFECRLDDVPVGCLTGSFVPAGDLSEGPHVLVVRATNPAGTTGPWASRGFLVDTTGPETVLVTPSPTQSASPTPLIAFHSDESSATFECSIDGSAYSPCVSPWATGTLAAGPHRVAVRALDQVGNPDATPATAEFTVGGGTPGRTDPLTSVRLLAERLVINLRMTVDRIRESEMPRVLRQRAVRVQGISSLVPGTLSVVGRASAARGRPIVLRGSLGLDQTRPGTLALRPTKKGRALMRRGRSVPLVVAAQFTTRRTARWSRHCVARTDQAQRIPAWRSAPAAAAPASRCAPSGSPGAPAGAPADEPVRWPAASGRTWRRRSGTTASQPSAGGSVRPRGSSPSSIRRRMSPLRFGLRYTWRWPTLGFCSRSPASRNASPTA